MNPDTVVPSNRITNFQTAAGITQSHSETRIRIAGIDGSIQASILKDSPNILSLGRMCGVLGCTFTWYPFEDEPTFYSPTGEELGIRVKDWVPYLVEDIKRCGPKLRTREVMNTSVAEPTPTVCEP